MKKVTILALLLLLSVIYSCSDVKPENKQNSLETNQSSRMQKEEVEIAVDSLTKEKKSTDWEKHFLKGKVKYASEHEYSVDENGEQVGMGGSHVSFDFDSTGRIIEKGTSGCCGASFRTIVYKYNDAQELTHRIIYNSDDWKEDLTTADEYSEKEKYFYKSGILDKVKKAGFNQQLTEEIEYDYKNGELTKETRFYVDDSSKVTIFYYQDDNSLTKEYFEKDTVFSMKEVDFSEDGRVVLRKRFEKDGSITEFKYKYSFDKEGNWVKRTSKIRGINPDGSKQDWINGRSTDRTIKYYD